MVTYFISLVLMNSYPHSCLFMTLFYFSIYPSYPKINHMSFTNSAQKLVTKVVKKALISLAPIDRTTPEPFMEGGELLKRRQAH